MPILLYHQVARFNPLPWVTHGAKFCEASAFRHQVALIHALGLSVVPVGEAAAKPGSVAFTFDDGFASFADYAWPALRRFGYPATVYLISSMLGRTSTWMKKEKDRHAPLLDASAVRRLAAEGVTFGSHGRTHRRLAELSADEQRIEIADSKKELEDLLQKPVTDFCYPYGSYTPTTVGLVREAGYRTAVTCRQAAARPADSPLELPRIPIQYSNTLLTFYLKCKS